MVILEIEDVKNICYEIAKAHFTFNEPFPSFESRYPNKLESALEAPRRSFENKLLYPNIWEQAAVLFYEIAKGQHPFVNGNKRMACIVMLTFLAINNRWLRLTWEQLYTIAYKAADSPAKESALQIKVLQSYIKHYLIDF